VLVCDDSTHRFRLAPTRSWLARLGLGRRLRDRQRGPDLLRRRDHAYPAGRLSLGLRSYPPPSVEVVHGDERYAVWVYDEPLQQHYGDRVSELLARLLGGRGPSPS
jgi:hypothetical protein